MVELSDAELRVLGCLLEKEAATPDVYPLTVNALLHACNQTSNRNPIVSYDEATVGEALRTLREKQLTRVVYSRSNRATKHRHVLDEALGLDERARAVLAVLLLRGPQTVGELRTRTERLAKFAGLDDVQAVLDELARRSPPLVAGLERQPGQKEARYVHLLAGPPQPRAPALAAPPASFQRQAAGTEPPEVRLDALAAAVAALRDEVAALRAELDELRRA